ncbi:MAG: hypothetical protein JKY70_21540 [Mucilaginibacter sp.]|nr:hypothetical protein [Mucilaginibacter sp.]
MKFKSWTLLLPLSVLANCKQAVKKYKQNPFQANQQGIWTNCARQNEGEVIVTGNVCLKLIFQQDSSGIVTDGAGREYKFFWTMRSDTLSFKNISEKDYKIYPDGLYKMTKLPKKTEEIVLYDIAKKTSYYLNH